MKINMYWCHLTNEQRKQVKAFYADEIKRKELFEHDLNAREYRVNVISSSIIFNKDF